MSIRILGIDPGYDRCGVAILEKSDRGEQLLYSNCLQTSKKEDFGSRLLTIAQSLEKIIAEWRPELVAVEKVFLSKNQKTASQVSEVRGVILYLAAKHALDTAEYTPLQIKQTITGYGKAEKAQVMDMVAKLVKLNNQKRLDDEYDAIAAALTASAYFNLSTARR